MHSASRRQHRRIIDRTHLFGSLTLDIATLGQSQAMCLVSSTPTDYGSIYYSTPVASKGEDHVTGGVVALGPEQEPGLGIDPPTGHRAVVVVGLDEVGVAEAGERVATSMLGLLNRTLT